MLGEPREVEAQTAHCSGPPDKAWRTEDGRMDVCVFVCVYIEVGTHVWFILGLSCSFN